VTELSEILSGWQPSQLVEQGINQIFENHLCSRRQEWYSKHWSLAVQPSGAEKQALRDVMRWTYIWGKSMIWREKDSVSPPVAEIRLRILRSSPAPTPSQWRNSYTATRGPGPLLSILHDYTQTRHIRWGSSGQVISPTQRPLPDNIHQKTHTHTHTHSHISMLPGEIQTSNPSKIAAADPRLKARGYWDRLFTPILNNNESVT